MKGWVRKLELREECIKVKKLDGFKHSLLNSSLHTQPLTPSKINATLQNKIKGGFLVNFLVLKEELFTVVSFSKLWLVL